MMPWFPMWECISSRLITKSLTSLQIMSFFLFWWDWRRIRIEWLRSSPITYKFKVITFKNNSSNKTSISMLVANYNLYLGLKPKDSEKKFIQKSTLMKKTKLIKYKYRVTEYKKFYVKKYLALQGVVLIFQKYRNSDKESNSKKQI